MASSNCPSDSSFSANLKSRSISSSCALSISGASLRISLYFDIASSISPSDINLSLNEKSILINSSLAFIRSGFRSSASLRLFMAESRSPFSKSISAADIRASRSTFTASCFISPVDRETAVRRGGTALSHLFRFK